MQNRLLKLTIMVSKQLFFGMLVLMITLGTLWANSGSAQDQSVISVKENIISLHLKNASLFEILETIESKTGYRFTYDRKEINEQFRMGLSFKQKPVEAILLEISKNAHLRFKQVNNNIHVKKILNNRDKQEEIEIIIQTRNVSGMVVTPEGEALPGVNVVVKGTTTGTVTNVEGRYSLEVPENALLVFSSVGYADQEIQVGNRSVIDVQMTEDIQQLEELVVIGYGTREKKDLTGAISQIESEEITKTTAMSPELAMQGRMPGVFISNPGSNPNARPEIRIRGVSTLGFNDPLYVIDGVPLYEGGASSDDSRTQDQRGDVNVFNMINPNDIESISVLKDASATAIYGVRASNGVILITTKRGKKGKPKVNLSAKYGVQNVYQDWDVMNTQDYIDATLEAWDNNPNYTHNEDYVPFYDANSPEYLGDNPYYTDEWLEAVRVKNAPIQDYNVNISGGNDMSNYAVGAGYAMQENALYYSRFDRYSAFVNSDHKLADWLKVGESFRFVYSEAEEDGGGGLGTAFDAPWQPLYDPNGLLGYALPGRTIDGDFISNGYGNSTRSAFLGIGELNTVKRDMIRGLGTFYAEVNPFDGLRIKGTFSFDYYTNTQQRYLDQRRGLFEANQGTPYSGEGNTYRRRMNENINLVKEFLIGYNKSFGDHNFDLILNAMDQQIKWNIGQNSIQSNSPITSWDQRRIDEGWAQEDKQVHFERYPSGLQGYMGRLSYNYASKYYLDATVRRDGSSKFGPGYKWGTFPSFAAAWRISSESFMSNIDWMEDLKIRAGWGQTGNQETRDFAFLSLVNFNPKYALGSNPESLGDGYINPAAVLGDFPIVDMSWETVTTLNFGFDGLFLDDRLNLTAEYYHRYTEGILQEIQIPDVIGALSQPVVNLATVSNSGIELLVGYNEQFGEIGFNSSLNLTTVKNEVGDLYRGRPSGGHYDRIEEGRPINFLWGYQTDGIFQTDAEVTEWLDNIEDPGNEAQKAPGDIRFVDTGSAPTEEDGEQAFRSSVPDGKIDIYDRVYLGKTIPGYYYGLNLGLDYKNFDFSINFRGMGDIQKIFTNGKQSIGGGGGNYLVDYLNRWTSDNPSNTIPRAIADDPSGNNRIADRHVEDAGFIRLQNFQLGYNLKSGLLERLSLSNMRVYISGMNTFVMSPYSGLDPENDTTPTTFMIGANLGF